MHAAQHLAEGKIKRALAGLIRRRFVMGIAFVIVGGMDLCAAAGVPRSMRKRALLRDEQQDDAKIMKIAARHVYRCTRYATRDDERQILLGDGNHRISKPIIKPHRIIFQHGEFAGKQYRLETVFHRRFGLHFNHLLGPAGQTE